MRHVIEWQRHHLAAPGRTGGEVVGSLLGFAPGYAASRSLRTMVTVALVLPGVVMVGSRNPTWSPLLVALVVGVPVLVLTALLLPVVSRAMGRPAEAAVGLLFTEGECIAVRSERGPVEIGSRMALHEVRWARVDQVGVSRLGGVATLVTLGGPDGEFLSMEVPATRPDAAERTLRRAGLTLVPPLAARAAWRGTAGVVPSA